MGDHDNTMYKIRWIMLNKIKLGDHDNTKYKVR